MNLLYAVRHGQSTTNASGLVPDDDAAVLLTELGERQAAAVGRWLAALDPADLPDEVWVSPYTRARETWRIAAQQLADPPPHHIDVRLRDREPANESFDDVAERLRAFLRDVRGEQVLVVAHDAVVLMLRKILGDLSDHDVDAISRDGLAGNASVTTWRGGELVGYDERGHLAEL